jgi:membrane-associated phospholipid phosphatase
VAHSFVSALAAGRVHRRLGVIAVACAALVAVSTLLTKQHYVVDVLAGIALAAAAFNLFLRRAPLGGPADLDRRAAPALAACVAAIVATGFAGFWLLLPVEG